MAEMVGGRRQYLRAVGGALAVGGLSGVSSATQSEVTITGRVEAYDGSPVAGRKLNFTKSTDGDYIETDSEGRFETTVMGDSNVTVALYKSNGMQLHAPVQNGVPHIYVLDKFYTRSADEDIGTLTAPEAYTVDLRALREDGSPASDAEFDFRANFSGSWFGASRHWLTATQDGFLRIRNADFTGVELSGSAGVTIEVPAESGATHKFETELDVSGPMTVTAQIGSGISVESGNSSSESSTTTTTATETTTTSSESTTTAEESTTTTTGEDTATTTIESDESSDSASSTTTTTTPNRGFFSNENPDDDVEFLSDPFVLTVGGFALSILGVLQNMVR